MLTSPKPRPRNATLAGVPRPGVGALDFWGVLDTRDLLRKANWKQRALLLLAVAAPLLLAVLFSIHQRSAVISEAHESAKRSVVALEQHAANVLDAHVLILRQLDILTSGRSPDQIRSDELLRITLSGFSREVAQVSAIGVTDARGNIITTSLGSSADGVSVGDRDYFVAHSRGAPGGVFISEAFTGRTTKQRQFALSIRRNLPGGEFGGVIFTTVPLEHFTSFWRGFTPSGGHLIPMVRPDGALIVRYPQTDSPQSLDPRGPFISHLTRLRKGLYTAVSLVDGVERINAYSQIKHYPLFISFSVETRLVLEAWRTQTVAVSLMAVLMAGLLAALWVAAMRESEAQREAAAKWEAAARALQDEIARRQHAEESLRQGVERLSFGDQLIGIVSHDLRNPLNAISLSAGVIARRDSLAPEDAKLLQRIQVASHRAADLIRDLLDFTQARLGGRIPVHARAMNFHELLQTVLAEVDATYPNRIECSLEAADASGEWDPDRLAQVVENLVVNAMKYGVEGGIVRVRTSSDEGSLEFQVHNDGDPIAENKIAGMFEPLQRGADASQPNPDRSIGIGLFIVKHIVDAHAGRITVDSTLERGTTFTVSLPRVR
jgi:signal transduction histidine kinase